MGNTKKQKGVTLVGVLVGITILSIALAAQIRLLGNTIRRDVELRNLIIATNLAREGIEILFSWRVTDGWGWLKNNKGNILCSDIRLNRASNCVSNQLNLVSYADGDEVFSDFKAYLYEEDTANEFDVPAFWRAMTVKSCDLAHPEKDDQCLVLVATTGWDVCSQEDWLDCVNSSSECSCKLVKLEKKIYNWYVP